MQIHKLTEFFGAEITGADVRDPEQFADIRQAFIDNAFIVLRGQHITPEEHLTFARRFGPINVNRFVSAVPDYPEIAQVIKEPDQTTAIGEIWHTEHSYDREPAMCSILHAVEVPPSGGDTLFASATAAYDALSDEMKQKLDGLSAWNSSTHAFGASQAKSESARTGRIGNADAATQNTLHPVVIRHPLSGRKAIYVNPRFTTRIEGLSEDESEKLLTEIYTHCHKPEFQTRISWRRGDVTMWDNRATWHKAINDYHGYRRCMHRITVDGCALKAA